MVKKSSSSRLAGISLLATLASTLLSQGASAKIPLTAFKGVTSCFKSGKEFFSPTLGEVALESHLIDNYRIFGNYTPYKDDTGTPKHAFDISNGDPIWDMVRVFFPSPTGQLNAESNREANFGNNVDKAETIAILLNYANNLREGNAIDDRTLKDSIFASLKSRPLIDTSEEEAKLTSFTGAIDGITETKKGERIAKLKDILKNEPDNALKKAINTVNNSSGNNLTADQLKNVKQQMTNAVDTYLNNKIQTKYKKEEERFKKNFLAETLNPLLKSIQDAIQGEKDSLYPEHTTEQVISSFFCFKFNTQQDIIDLIQNLDDSIVNKSNISQISELKEEDLTDIATHSTYDMDDIFALETADIWGQFVPYRDGSAPLSNGSTFQYDRTNNNRLETQKRFPDCAEIAARHLINMLLYNKGTRDWDLSYIESHMATHSPGNKYFHNFKEFYKVQHPTLANSGNIEMRSLWNTVVGDLNAYGEGTPITYALNNNTNELETGFINLIRVFEKIFSLPLKPFPVPIAGKEKENLEAKKSWIKESFETFFSVMNPTKTYHMDFSRLKETGNEISGNLPITVSDTQTHEELYSFTFYSKYGYHSEVKSLQTIKELDTRAYIDDLKLHPTLIPVNTAEEAVWMMSSDPEVKWGNLKHPLYSLFGQGLEDNRSKIEFLNELVRNYDELKAELLKTSAFKVMLSNILGDFSWGDFNEVNEISPVIFSLFEKGDFNDVLAKTVKAIEFEEILENTGSIIQKLENLEDIYLPKNGVKDFSFLTTEHPNIKMINASKSSIKSLKGLNNLPGLKVLNLSSSAIEDLSGFGAFESLEELDLNGTRSLDKLSFTQLCPQLKKINLAQSAISAIENLGNCPNLEELDFGPSVGVSNNLKNISFNGPLNKLTKLDLTGAENLETLTGLDCPNLEVLGLSSHKLKKLILNESMSNLRILDTEVSGLEEIEGLYHCLRLEKLQIWNASLKSPPVVNNDLIHLEHMSFHNVHSGISTFAGLLEKSPNLVEMDMNNVGIRKPQDRYSRFSTGPLYVPEKLSFNRPHNALKKISIVDSGLGEIEGLEYCPNLEEINLKWAHIKKLVLSDTHEKLRKINLNSGRIESFEGLDHCPNLKELDLRETKYSGTLTFEKDNKDLVIRGVSKSQIRGIEHLDDSNILE